MTPIQDGDTEPCIATTDRALPITGLLRVTDRHPGTGLQAAGRRVSAGHRAEDRRA